MRLRAVVLTACVTGSALAASSVTLEAPSVAGAATSVPAPHLARPDQTATALVQQFFRLLHQRNTKGLETFLSPSFQLQRADGSGATKSEYVRELPSVLTFHLTDIHATVGRGVLVVTYLATVTGVTNGKPDAPGPAPRLSVFVWNGRRWQLTAHSNFEPLG